METKLISLIQGASAFRSITKYSSFQMLLQKYICHHHINPSGIAYETQESLEGCDKFYDRLLTSLNAQD